MTKTIDALLLRADNTAEWVQVPVDDEGSTLAGLQALVGGWIEAVSLGDETVMWANEEGYLKAAAGKPGFGRNPFASVLAVAANGGWSPIVGPCVVTGDQGSRTVALPREQGDQILTLHASRDWIPA